MAPTDALIESLLQRVLLPALQGEPALREAVGAFDADLRHDGDDLLFTLPALHAFLCRRPGTPPAEAAADYRSFRRAVYAGGLNARLRTHGGEVVVERADDDHGRSCYRLRRLGGAAAA